MRLIKNAKQLGPRLWSVRLSLLAALLSAADVAFSFWGAGKPSVVVIGSFLISIGAAIGRLILQESLHAEPEA